MKVQSNKIGTKGCDLYRWYAKTAMNWASPIGRQKNSLRWIIQYDLQTVNVKWITRNTTQWSSLSSTKRVMQVEHLHVYDVAENSSQQYRSRCLTGAIRLSNSDEGVSRRDQRGQNLNTKQKKEKLKNSINPDFTIWNCILVIKQGTC